MYFTYQTVHIRTVFTIGLAEVYKDDFSVGEHNISSMKITMCPSGCVQFNKDLQNLSGDVGYPSQSGLDQTTVKH